MSLTVTFLLLGTYTLWVCRIERGVTEKKSKRGSICESGIIDVGSKIFVVTAAKSKQFHPRKGKKGRKTLRTEKLNLKCMV